MNNQLKSIITSLFLIILGIGIGMFIFRKGDFVMVDTTTYKSAIQGISATINTDNERFEINYRSLDAEFNNSRRSRSRPVLIGIDSIRIKREVFNQLVATTLLEIDNSRTTLPDSQQTNLFSDLIKLANQQDASLFLQLEEMLQNNSKELKVRPKEIAQIIATAHNRYDKMLTSFNLAAIPISKDIPIFKLKVLTAQMFRFQRLHFFEQLFSKFLSSSCFIFERYFPVLNPKKACIQVGEYFESEIGIGKYYSSIDTSNFKLFVNGERLLIDGDSGTGKYRSLAKKSGPVELVLECQSTNPFSGEIWKGTSTYSYEIR